MGSLRGVAVAAGCAFALVSAGVAEAGRRPAGSELTADDLGWPSTTQSVRTRVAAKVYDRPHARSRERIGKIARGQRLAWTQIVSSRDACKAWIAIEPRGWVCARHLAPDDAEPATTAVPRRVLTGTKLAGIDLVAAPVLPTPFAWAVEPQRFRKRQKPRPARPVVVRREPRADAERARSLAPRTVVPILAIEAGFVRIGDDEWVALRDLRVVRTASRPPGVRDDERWIDVDLDQQVLVAYDGDTPVYATLISSGRRSGTPTGISRIRKKVAIGTMRDPDRRWKIPKVPFIMKFREAYAVHGAYWHDLFGNQRSVGCVNLAPVDAGWLFAWTEPHIPEGWLEARALGDEGTPIRIRSRTDRDPAWIDFDEPPPRFER
jgi:hypothetical protein